jgi:nitroreductase
MDILQTIARRRSIRAFKPNQISDEILTQVLKAAQAAPSAGNRQAREIIVVKDNAVKAALAEAAFHQFFLQEAPVDLVFCANPLKSQQRYGERGHDLYCILDTAASIQNVLLAAHAFGLGSCWVGAFNEEAVREAVMLTEDVRPITLVPLGYPAEQPDPTERLSLEEFVHAERYGQPWRKML